MTDPEGILTKPPFAARLPGVALAVLIAAVAYVARLVPVVRGASLRGMNSYDGAVYSAAAAVLRPLCVAAALVGGLFYAVFYPTVFIEHSTLLEGPAATVTPRVLR
jgi:hypothetical protein